MTNNSSVNPYYFQFTTFADYGALKYLFFILCLLFYMSIICANVGIITIVYQEKSLHQPMYIFICCLSVNALYGSAAFFPRFLTDILSDTHWISRPSCFVQMYFIYLYVSCDLKFVSAMAYDRYIAICQPLHYHAKMTPGIVRGLIVVIVVMSICHCVVGVLFVARLTLCGYKLERTFCSNWPVVKLTCGNNIKDNQIYGQVFTVLSLIPLFFVMYTYLRILIVCMTSSREFRWKAFQTCLPHTTSFLAMIFSLFFEQSYSRYKTDDANPAIEIFSSLLYVALPPIFNPLIYGLKMPQIRAVIVLKSASCIRTLKVNMHIVSR
ncbi:olfactory receptor-like protein OLF4 [Mugil cephalus]|uniref:olfactory receptor-like protein OLF4 n=1 Tax=Mugil cephalus TaxID=48193 RepID=UPI001FB58050|nr:olfactory receptor-like protein OLF4 [Mugil cephalus]